MKLAEACAESLGGQLTVGWAGLGLQVEDVPSGLELTGPGTGGLRPWVGETLVGGRKVEAGCFVVVSLPGHWKATLQVEGALWVLEVVDKVWKVE